VAQPMGKKKSHWVFRSTHIAQRGRKNAEEQQEQQERSKRQFV